MDWHDVLIPHVHADQAERLLGARVGFVGAGGLGSNCAALLVRCGVRKLVIADHDVVSLSNLNRQFYFPEHLGRPKVEALYDSLHCLLSDSLPALDYTGHVRRVGEDDASLFAACDIVVEAVDNAETKRMVVGMLLDAGHTVVSASGMAGWGGEDMRRKRLGKLTVVGDFVSAVGPDAPPMAPRVMMAAAMQADEVLWRLLSAF